MLICVAKFPTFRSATHLDIIVATEEKNIEINIVTLFNYAVLAEVSFPLELTTSLCNRRFLLFILFKVGPVIDGDMVVQGTTLDSSHGPSLCVVEYAESYDHPFEV